MNDILEIVRDPFAAANFGIRDLPLNRPTGKRTVFFEDPTVLGFVIAFDDATSLINEWQSVADAIAKTYSHILAAAGGKAWNTYLVLLTSAEADFGETLALGQIEENLRGMRKIARAGISGSEAARSALLPLLPFRAAPSLDPIDMPAEISARASEIDPAVILAFLSDADESVVLTVVEDKA